MMAVQIKSKEAFPVQRWLAVQYALLHVIVLLISAGWLYSTHFYV